MIVMGVQRARKETKDAKSYSLQTSFPEVIKARRMFAPKFQDVIFPAHKFATNKGQGNGRKSKQQE